MRFQGRNNNMTERKNKMSKENVQKFYELLINNPAVAEELKNSINVPAEADAEKTVAQKKVLSSRVQARGACVSPLGSAGAVPLTESKPVVIAMSSALAWDLLIKKLSLLKRSNQVLFMKKILFLVFIIGIFLPFKAAAWKALDYSYSGNWVVCEKKIRENCEVDLFYVLPTIYSDKNNSNILYV